MTWVGDALMLTGYSMLIACGAAAVLRVDVLMHRSFDPGAAFDPIGFVGTVILFMFGLVLLVGGAVGIALMVPR